MSKKNIIIAAAGLIIIGILFIFITRFTRSGVADDPEATTIEIDLAKYTTESTTMSTTPETEPETEPEAPFRYPLNFGPADKEPGGRAVMIVYDNLYKARPQSGLTSADVCIEVLAEGMITRILAVFYSDFPEKYGPIRSARPYMVDKALEFDAYFAHVGGSMQGLADILELRVAGLNGLISGAFKRYPPRKPPHNTYAIHEDLLKQADDFGYRSEVTPKFLEFSEKPVLNGEDATSIEINYRAAAEYSDYSDPGYKVSYIYNSESSKYERFINGEQHIDDLNNEQITVTNIIIQECGHRVIDAVGRLKIDLVGEGAGAFLKDGKFCEIRWKKDSRSAMTEYFDLDGQPIKLSMGKTFIQIVKPNSYVFN